ncbi:Voltage-gated ion channel superfamily, partial [Globisporangium splendens]
MVVGGGIFAYGISNVVALSQQLYVDETEHRHKMDNVNTFMHTRSLPRKLRDEIRTNFFHMRKAMRESKQHDYEIFQQMSRTLQSNVAALFCQEMMPRKMPFLAGCNAEFIHELYLSMEVKCYLPGEDIIWQDDYGTEMYFLFVGHVQVFLSHTKVAALGPNAFFGEFGIFNPKKPRLATIQALDFCETHCIQRCELFRILVCHPFMLRTIQQLATLRSRKALNILYESGGKSRTLLQGLASMWLQEGILALLPRELVASKDEFPSLQEYLPVTPIMAFTSAAGCRASVRASFMNASGPDANAAGGGTTSRHKSVVVMNGGAEPPSTTMRTLNQLRGNVPSSAGKSAPQRRTLIGAADKGHLMKTLASIGHQRSVEFFDQEKAHGRANKSEREATGSTGPTPSSTGISTLPPLPSISDERMDTLMRQTHEVVKRQELLDEQLQGLLTALADDPHGLNRFREHYQLNAAPAPLVREHSQYFHRSQSIREGDEGRHAKS